MEDNKLYALIWKLAATCFCVFVISMAGCTANNSRLRAQLLENATDPIATRCAFDGTTESTAAICGVIAARK